MILLVMDDLDARSFPALTRLGELARSRGAIFDAAYCTTPLCGPARASIFRGQYVHNHGVWHNNGDQGGFSTFYRDDREDSTLATWLHDAGYRTALVGKYLNGYPRPRGRDRDREISALHIPPGWDEWIAQQERGALGGGAFQLNVNGEAVRYAGAGAEYSTDVLAGHALAVVERALADDAPFFLYLAPLAPHYPLAGAERHADLFAGEHAPRVPSYDPDDTGMVGKPAFLAHAARFTAEQIAAIDASHRERLRSLQAVDELIDRLVALLDERGAGDNTWVFVTSDHGWHQGEHRLPFGKETPYEESIRVPLAVLGPGLHGEHRDEFVLNIDFAPTIAELAGAPCPAFVDGRSFAPVLAGAPLTGWRRDFLVEHQPIGKTRAWNDLGKMPLIPAYRALRVRENGSDFLYARYTTGERELYDLAADPYEQHNLASSAAPAWLARLDARLDDLAACAGSNCRAPVDASSDAP